jgi:hypothetical protein
MSTSWKFLHVRPDYGPLTPLLENRVLHPKWDKLPTLNDVIAARLLWMNCAFRLLSKKVQNDKVSVRNFCSENNWYVICKKKNQTPAQLRYRRKQ